MRLEQKYVSCMRYFCIDNSLSHNTGNITNINFFPKQQILDSSKLKEFADNSFKFDENCRKFSKWVENTVGKGEIACYKQRLPLPTCKNQGLFRKALREKEKTLVTS